MDNETKIKNVSWVARIAGVLAWTAAWGLLFVFWVASMAQNPELAANDASLGMATCMAAGCTGGLWFMGLLVFAVIYAVIRR